MARPTVSIQNLNNITLDRPTMKNEADPTLSAPLPAIEQQNTKNVSYTVDDLLAMTTNEIKPIVDKLPETIYDSLQEKFDSLSSVNIFSRNVTWQKNINELLAVCKVLQFKPVKRHSRR